MSDENTTWKSLIVPWLVSLMVIACLGLAGQQLFGLCQQKQGEYEAKVDEVRLARQENARLQAKNQQLSALVEHLNTDEGVEQIARDKLGLAKPGEMAFVVVPAPPARTVYKTAVPDKPDPEPQGIIARLLHRVFSR